MAEAGPMDWAMGGASVLGAFMSSKAAKRAAEERRRQALADRAMLTEETENAAADIRRSADPLNQQAGRLEIQAGHRDASVEQGLLAGLRQQAAGASRQEGASGVGSTSRQLVASQLMQGQGLLASEGMRLKRFTDLSGLAANLRGQGAQILGNAAQTRLQGMQAVSQIEVPVDGTSAWGTALTAFGSS